ncbi:Uncharacterised protein [Mycoplasmopsis citelli]|uniref:Uncharacterized protein n=1 Tax=Mycoplasmopsis citelli TaxID=171281 RepID=A0A449B110_9BACT|nr:hypothetical protein [Mycoplasmopsis citelli]VEU74288.1 Uncharacterised protein [Mycoplasmopsis citelli]
MQVDAIRDRKYKKSEFAQKFLKNKGFYKGNIWKEKASLDIEKYPFHSNYLEQARDIYWLYNDTYYKNDYNIKKFLAFHHVYKTKDIFDSFLGEEISKQIKDENEFLYYSDFFEINDNKNLQALEIKTNISVENFLTKIEQQISQLNNKEKEDYISKFENLINYYGGTISNRAKALEILNYDTSKNMLDQIIAITTSEFKESEYAREYMSDNDIYSAEGFVDEIAFDLKEYGIETHYASYLKDYFDGLYDKDYCYDVYYQFDREDNGAKYLRSKTEEEIKSEVFDYVLEKLLKENKIQEEHTKDYQNTLAM